MPPQRAGRVRRWLPRGVAAALVCNLLAAVVLAAAVRTADTGGSGSTEPQASAHGSGSSHARPLPGAPGAGTARDPATVEQVRKLLARRAEAVRSGDRAAFLATIASSARRFRVDQRRLFSNLTKLPLAHWSYEISRATVPAPRRLANPEPGTWTPRITLHYQLDGFDRRPITRTRYLTVSRVPGRGWLFTGDGSAGSAGPANHRGDPAIWDFGRLEAVRGDHTLVLGAGAEQSLLRSLADRLDRAVSVVSGVWGEQWSQRAVVVVPPGRAEATAIAGGRQSLTQLAGLATVVSGPAGVPPAGSGDRIVLAPDNFDRLTPVGRQVVLTHELTHVATRGSTSEATPLWLVEGFADYVGYRAVDVPVRKAALELAGAVQAGRVPDQLPSRSDFGAGNSQLSQAYEAAWLACRLIAHSYGQDQLVALYRETASRDGPPRQVVADSFADVLGVSLPRFTERWRSYMREQLT